MPRYAIRFQRRDGCVEYRDHEMTREKAMEKCRRMNDWAQEVSPTNDPNRHGMIYLPVEVSQSQE